MYDPTWDIDDIAILMDWFAMDDIPQCGFIGVYSIWGLKQWDWFAGFILGGFLELGTFKPMAYPLKIHLLTDLTNPQVLSEHLQETLLPGGHLRAALWGPDPHVQCAREVSDSWSWFILIHHWIVLNRGIYRYLPVMFSNFWWKWEDDLQGHFHFSGSAVFPRTVEEDLSKWRP